MNEVDRTELVEILNTTLDGRDRIGQDKHSADHEFITTLKLERKEKREFWTKIKGNVFGWAIIVGLGSIGTATYHFFFKPQ